MFRRLLVAAAVLAVVAIATVVVPAAAKANKAIAGHTLIVTVEKNLAPAAEKKLAVLVLISRHGGAPAGALVTASKPLTVRLESRAPYLLKAEIDAACSGSCGASDRVSGSSDHRLEILPSCQPKGRGFVCNAVKIVRVF